MKGNYFYLLFIFLITSITSIAQQAPFITTWEVGFLDTITIPTSGSGYNYTVDFGDGRVFTNVTGDKSHTYSQAGVYTITISGNFPRIRFKNLPLINRKLKSIEQWGDIQWQSMEGAFAGCLNLVINATDAPDLSAVTDASYMFERCAKLNQPLNHWDVTGITNMTGMFAEASIFNQPLDNWNVASSTNMSSMFRKATAFNQNLNSWNVANATDLSHMFSEAVNYNQPLNNWNVSSVTNMTAMFQKAALFNQPIGNWNVSNVTDMSYLFQDAEVFNQNINNWNVSNVTNMSYMLSVSHLIFNFIYNQPLNNWDVSNVVNMEGMFTGADRFNQTLSTWNVSNVTNMADMFYGAERFNQNLNSWNVNNVTNMSGMFRNVKTYNHPLANWNVSNVTNMKGMFWDAFAFNQDITGWNVANVTDMGYMFAGSTTYFVQAQEPYTQFNQPIVNWNVSNVQNMEFMFMRSMFSHDINNWNVSNATNMKGMFKESNSFNFPLTSWNVLNVVAMDEMFEGAQNFNQDLSIWNFNNDVTLQNFISRSGMNHSNYDALLSRFKNLNLQNKTLDAENISYCNEASRIFLINNLGWTITNDRKFMSCNQTLTPGAFVTQWFIPHNAREWSFTLSGPGYNYTIDFGDGTVLTNQTAGVFHRYREPGVYQIQISGDFPKISFYSHNLLSVEQWGDIQWTSMNNAFSNCTNVKIKAIDAPDLSQVSDMRAMFSNTHFNQSINHWDVSNVTNMSSLFGVTPYFNQPLDNWNVSAVTDMSYMFYKASAFNQLLNNWDVSGVTTMFKMFEEAHSFNQTIGDWNVSGVRNITEMFKEAYSFNQPLRNWDISNVPNINGMFYRAKDFNQPLDQWEISNITELVDVFSNASSFNQSLDTWNVSNVTVLRGVFSNATSFNQPLNSWDVSNVTDFLYLFSRAESFNQPLDNWDMSSANILESMFQAATSFNQPLNNWNVSNVINMKRMFMDASAFNQPLEAWDVSSAYQVEEMFHSASSFNQPLNNWDVSSFAFMKEMFRDASSFNQPLNNWQFSSANSMEGMFREAKSFNQPLNNWDVSGVTRMTDMFLDTSGFNQDLSDWEISTGYLNAFVEKSGLDIRNYEAFLSRLAQLNIQNGQLSSYGLEYCNDEARTYLMNQRNWSILGDSQSTECNWITGTILYDDDRNGCDPDDTEATGIMVKVSDTVNDYFTFSDNGNYSITAYGPEFTVSVVNNPDYFSVAPESATVSFDNLHTHEVDFCLSSNATVNDLSVRMISLNEARPGFEARYQLIVENIGTNNAASVSVSFEFDGQKQSFLSASPAPSSTTNNQLNFEFTDLPALGRKIVNVNMLTFQPPVVEGGDIINFTARVFPDVNDYTPDDNTFIYAQEVVNSFDPNDKQVMQGGQVYITDINRYLDYVIRFQNTGTASAINVRILDTLDSRLDWSSFRPLNASHDYRIEISNGNKVEFFFDHIDLPHEGANEPESHGFVAFKIKPKNTVQVGDVIAGDARIYFDFNPPIITNTVTTEIIDRAGSVSEQRDLQDFIKIYPNPASDILNIQLNGNLQLHEVVMYGIQGREIMRTQNTLLNVNHLETGIYFLKISTDRGTVNRRFIKEGK